jgi:hypothetical protein
VIDATPATGARRYQHTEAPPPPELPPPPPPLLLLDAAWQAEAQRAA